MSAEPATTPSALPESSSLTVDTVSDIDHQLLISEKQLFLLHWNTIEFTAFAHNKVAFTLALWRGTEDTFGKVFIVFEYLPLGKF